jgi:hypothetical protein
MTPLHHTTPSPRMPRTRGFRGTHRRLGLGLVEAVVTLVALAGVLGGLVATSTSLRTGSSEQQTRTTLRQLRLALNRYVADHGDTLPGPTARALATLLQDPAARGPMSDLVFAADEQGRSMLRDGYGHAILYVGPEAKLPQGADFVSPGPDGKFGTPGISETPGTPSGGGGGGDRRAALDDVYGADTYMEIPTP